MTSNVSIGYLRLLAEEAPTQHDRDHFTAIADEIERLWNAELLPNVQPQMPMATVTEGAPRKVRRSKWKIKYLEAAAELEDVRKERNRYFDSACEWANERDELRALITAWADAYESIGQSTGGTEDEVTAYWTLVDALRKAVGR